MPVIPAGAHMASAMSNTGDNPTQNIILIMIVSGAMVFIDHARSGEPQTGNQFIALGIVGFVLLIVGQFAPDLAFMFAILFLVSILLNSPKGIPLVPPSTKTTKKAAA